jgi:hypothetical protein
MRLCSSSGGRDQSSSRSAGPIFSAYVMPSPACAEGREFSSAALIRPSQLGGAGEDGSGVIVIHLEPLLRGDRACVELL